LVEEAVMTSYAGGTQVKKGYYIDGKTFAFTNIERDGEALPADPDTRFVKIPTLAVMAVAPALGGLFVVLLPFVGFGVALHAIGRRLGQKARAGASEVAATLAHGLIPGEAHLAGKPAEKSAGPRPCDSEADALAKEIDEKRAPKS
jgi:hypothetical protein